MNDGLLDAAARHGCEEMLLGFESGSNSVLRRIRKGFTVEEALDTFRQASRHVSLDVSFIWGFPFETVEDLYETLIALSEISRLPKTSLHGHLLCAFRRSALYEEFGHLASFSEEFYPTQRAFLPSEWLSDYPELVELIQAHPRIFSAYYYYDHPELTQ